MILLPFDPAWQTTDDIPSDWSPGPLAPRPSVLAAVKEVFPEASESDGLFDLKDGTQLDVGEDNPTESVNVHLHVGADLATIERLVRFASLLGTRDLDIQSGDFLAAEDGANSYADWEAWTKKILTSG